jgi:hydroxypyruvate isomerase|tara:strand:+ start:885 stop:1664 length:780 start_codon:yes stop_codon:yes gene_type:complete
MPLKQSVMLPAVAAKVEDKVGFIEKAASIGVDAIELLFVDDEFEALCDAAAQHGLKVAGMGGHQSLGDGLNNPANHDRIEDELKTSIDLASSLRIASMICFSGNRIPGMSEDEAVINTAAGLRRAAPYAEAKGVTLNLELLNSRVDHPGYQCDRTAWGVQVVEQVGSERVKLLYDIYHMQIMEGDVIRTMLDNLGAIGHLHTAGNPGRNDLDDEQELYYPGICRALANAGYQHYIGHEFVPKGDPVAALRQAYERCTGD